MKYLVLPLFAVALAACDTKAEAPPENAAETLAAGNTMYCLAGGAAFDGQGEQVQVGSFGIAGDIFSLNMDLRVERDGRSHRIGSSLMAIPLRAGTYYFPDMEKPGYSYADYKIRNAQDEPVESYEGPTYGMHFSPIENDPETRLKLEVDKVAVGKASLPGFKRVDLSGRFTFNAAALPDGQTSEACLMSSLKRSLGTNGKPTLPMFDAQACGTKKIHVACRYKIAGEYLVHPPAQ